ncbi:hypothetical protein E2562_017918, partial [Oryza meyeriana var. granulata]
MVVAMVSGNNAAPVVNPFLEVINLLLQAAPFSNDDPEALHTETLLEGATVNGDAVLHAMMATYGENGDFLRNKCAENIFSKATLQLLFKNGDTILHCAARAGRYQMVSHLIDLARGGSSSNDDDSSRARVQKLLGTENELKETVLHEAVRIGDNAMVELLLKEYPGLASHPKDGTSPLFLAILLQENNIVEPGGKKNIVETLYNMSDKNLSYSGHKGQNALHAAVLRGTGLTKKLLKWNKKLTTERDENGSTPLHFAAARYFDVVITHLGLIKPLEALALKRSRESVCWHVLDANPAALYYADKDGLYPIHVAASAGAVGAVSIFVNKAPGCAGLRDAKRRTFLHVAVERGQVDVVRYACSNILFSWILNMQDSAGNTALHLAVQEGSLQMFSVLFRNLQVRLNLTNNNGKTPLDISHFKIPRGMHSIQNNEPKIHYALALAGARNGSCHFQQSYTQQ